jgi:hypothetical protein
MIMTGGREAPAGFLRMPALEGDRHPFPRRIEVGKGQPAALDRLHVRLLHLRDVVDEQELAEVVIDAGPLQVLAG